MPVKFLYNCLFLIFVFFTPVSFGAVTLGQVENFSGGVGGWVEGGPSPNPPTVVVGGGPDGSNHLQNISSGGGPGSRLAMFNTSSLWTGDYSGIDAISLSARNASSGTLISLRLAFNGAGGWWATDAVVLSADNLWSTAAFDIDEASLNYVSGGTGNYADTFTNVTNFEIFSAASSSLTAGSGLVRGDVLDADLRIDNIAAVPEPSSLVLFAMSGIFLLGRRR